MTLKSSKVFTSYAHESDSHNDKVFELSEKLRSEGVDSYIDQYEVSPSEGWPRWTRNQIQQADFVLVVCTEAYKKRYEGSEVPGTGAGAKWEGAIITQEFYDAEGRNTKFIPVVFNRDDIKEIPREMRGGTYYVLDSDAEYDDLYRHLTDQPKTVKRELGKLRSLPPKKRKEVFPDPSVNAADGSASVVPKVSETRLPLVMLWQVGGKAVFVEVERIRSAGKTIDLSIVPSSPRQASVLSELERRRELVGLAYNETAMFVRMKSLEQIIERGRDVWHLEFELDEYATRGASGAYNLSGFSAEQVAEMRARRILLNESLSTSIGTRANGLTTQLIEHSVAAAHSTGFAVLGSPFPGLFEDFKEETSVFLEASRLSAVLLLLLSNTVQTIDRLDLIMHSETELAVRFQGTRPPQYVNRDPQTVAVEGVCKLVTS